MKTLFTAKNAAVWIFVLSVSLCSCMSTREYVKTTNRLYQDEVLVAETQTLTLDGNVKEESSKQFYDLSDVYSSLSWKEEDEKAWMTSFVAQKESQGNSGKITFTLMEYVYDKASNTYSTTELGKKEVKTKNGNLVSQNDQSGREVKAKGDKFNDEWEEAFNNNLGSMLQVINGEEKNALANSDSEHFRTVTECEKVVVNSTPNGKYIFYSIVGKPFVIAGVTAWNLIKCAGYALINFGGGYNATTGKANGKLWYMPSYKKAKEKAVVAREANKIQYYPEYHLPFTNNTIVVDKYDRDITVLSVEDGEIITPIEHQELNNTMEVSRSAAADAASTAAVAGMIGTAVTIPVSVATWVGGAVVGVMGAVK